MVRKKAIFSIQNSRVIKAFQYLPTFSRKKATKGRRKNQSQIQGIECTSPRSRDFTTREVQSIISNQTSGPQGTPRVHASYVGRTPETIFFSGPIQRFLGLRKIFRVCRFFCCWFASYPGGVLHGSCRQPTTSMPFFSKAFHCGATLPQGRGALRFRCKEMVIGLLLMAFGTTNQLLILWRIILLSVSC